MKAYLSNREFRATFDGLYIQGGAYAIGEAKRILAETEPQSGQTFYALNRPGYEFRYAKEALAVALQSFLDSPDPIGYLISDQPMAG